MLSQRIPTTNRCRCATCLSLPPASRRRAVLFRVALTCLLTAFGAVPVAHAQLLPPVEIKGEPTAISPDAFFGRAVAIDGNVVVVGAPRDDLGPGLNEAGSVVVFELDPVGRTLVPTHWLNAPIPAAEDEFGSAVDVVVGGPGEPDFLIVGAPYADRERTDQGAAYIFRRIGGAWELDHELTTSGPDAYAELGRGVAIDASVPASSLTGDLFYTAVVASPFADRPSASSYNHGVVTVLQRVGAPAGWLRTHEFYGAEPADYPDTSWDIDLGYSVALDGDVLVAGAPSFDGVEDVSGAVYAFGRGNNLPGGDFVWFFDSAFEASDPKFFRRLGQAVAIDGKSLIIAAGDPGDDDAATDAGAVYIFSHLGSTEVQKLFASDAAANQEFGIAVAMDDDLLLVGSPGNYAGGEGAIYLFQRTGGPGSWTEIAKLAPTDGTPSYDTFGSALGIDGRTALAAVARDGMNLNPLGAAYVYDASGVVFSDGFESGNLTAWSSTAP